MTEPTDLPRWRHDLRNQLGIVLGFSELLLGELDPASPQRPDVAEIHNAAKRALELVASMPGTGESAEKEPT
jgi:signal transduction histidine kinase